MSYTPEQIAKNKRSHSLPNTWGREATVSMLRQHGPSVTRFQFIRALALFKPEARAEIEARTVLRRTKNRVYIRMEDPAK